MQPGIALPSVCVPLFLKGPPPVGWRARAGNRSPPRSPARRAGLQRPPDVGVALDEAEPRLLTVAQRQVTDSLADAPRLTRDGDQCPSAGGVSFETSTILVRRTIWLRPPG